MSRIPKSTGIDISHLTYDDLRELEQTIWTPLTPEGQQEALDELKRHMLLPSPGRIKKSSLRENLLLLTNMKASDNESTKTE